MPSTKWPRRPQTNDRTTLGSAARPVPRWLQLQEATPRKQRRNYDVLFNALWVLIGMIGGALILALYVYMSDLLLPGVGTMGIDLGGQSMRKAAVVLGERWEQHQIVLELEDGGTEVIPEVLGVTLDVNATMRALHRQGRSWPGVLAVMGIGEPLSVAPVLRLNRSVASANLEALASRFDVPPVDAGLDIVDGRAVVTTPVTGRRLDVAATVEKLAASLDQVVAERRLPLATMAVPPDVTNTDLAAVAEQIDQLLAAPLIFSLYDPVTDRTVTWTVPPQAWGEWLVIDLHPVDGSPFQWAIDPAQVKTFLDRQASTLSSDQYVRLDAAVSAATAAVSNGLYMAELRVYHRDRRHVVQPGETLSSIAWRYGMPYPWLEQANPGASGNLFAGQELVVPSPDKLLPLPIVRNKRIVVSLSQQRMWAYENGSLKWEWPVSTGIDDSPTSPGVFQIQSHVDNAYAGNWDLWMPYFMGIYEPVPGGDFMNGFHGFPTRGGNTLLWTGDLGHPVTFGCILLSTDNAALLYHWAEEGVVVEVRP